MRFKLLGMKASAKRTNAIIFSRHISLARRAPRVTIFLLSKSDVTVAYTIISVYTPTEVNLWVNPSLIISRTRVGRADRQ